MNHPYRCLAAALMVLTVAVGAQATEPVATVIAISDLDCPSCAKRVAAKLGEIPGVKSVKTDVDAGTATVTPMPGRILSSRALWEAVEKANKKPTRLEGPAGKFTAKPKA